MIFFLQLFLFLKDEEILLQSRAEGSEKDGHCLLRLYLGSPVWRVVPALLLLNTKDHVKRLGLHGQPGNGRSGARRTKIPSKPLRKSIFISTTEPNLQCLGEYIVLV